MKSLRLAALTLAALLAGGGAFVPQSLAQTKEWKTVRVGTEGAYPPFNNLNARGELEGFEIDYGKALCETLKLTCTFVAQDWDGIIPALLAGKYDVIIAGMSMTDERRKRVDFSRAYAVIPPAFIAGKRVTSTDVSPAALRGKVIGAQSSTVHANFLEKYYARSSVKLYPTQEEANLDLASGRLDYIVADKQVLLDFLAHKSGECCKLVADVTPEKEIHGDGVGMAFRKEDAALRALFDKAIEDSLKDGTHEKAAAKWFSVKIM